MRFASIFVIASLLTQPVLAQDTRSTPTLGQDLELVYPMNPGQTAPFPGVLFSSKATAKVIAEYSLFDERLQLEVETAVSVAQAKMNFELKEQESRCTTEKSTLQAQLAAREDKLKIFERDLKNSEEEIRKLKEEMPSRATWFGLGFAGGLVFTIATAYAIGQVVN